MANEFKVTTVAAIAGGPSTFVLEQNSAPRLVLTSTSAVVQFALLSAYVVGGKVAPEIYASSGVIKRVPAFEKDKRLPSGQSDKYKVNRVATQRGPGGVDHLEVFVVQRNSSQEIAFNVFDPFLQQLLMAAFQYEGQPPDEVGLDLGIDGNDLVRVQLSRGMQ